MINEQLLDILVCPKCKGAISVVEGGRALLCEECQLKYPVRENIPIMLVEEAVDLRRQDERESVDAHVPAATFRIIDGPNRGQVLHIEKKTCKAIGRALADTVKTEIFNVDLTLALDDSTRGLILQYITRQFRKSGKTQGKSASGELGYFRRTSDIVLDDISVSRLHAMIFYDDAGVGILDLVSKNGTFVNGEEIESRLLQKGDAVEIGESKFIFEG